MRFVALFALCFAAVAATSKTPGRIAGGTETTIDQYPEIASLLYSLNGATFTQACGGTILNNRSILSAAHCFFGHAASSWRARLGSSFADSGGTVYNVASIITHPDYSSINTQNDIAILRTATSITYSSTIRAARIAGSNYNLAANKVLWTAGWGATTSLSSTGLKEIGGRRRKLF
ncbi:trypsin, alkaline C-like [Aphomia sociella]